MKYVATYIRIRGRSYLRKLIMIVIELYGSYISYLGGAGVDLPPTCIE